MSELNPRDYKNGEPIKRVTTDADGEPTLTPTPKLVAAGVAGAITILVVFVVQSIFPGFEIPAEVSSAFTVLISFAAGYFKRPGGVG